MCIRDSNVHCATSMGLTSLNGADPVAYILSANVARRNLTKGQRAMAVARLVKNSQQHAAEIVGVSQDERFLRKQPAQY